MHDADARRLYVDVAEPLAERAALLALRGSRTTDEERSITGRSAPSLRRARSIAEAEAELEKELRSGYRVVVAFERPRRGGARPLQPRPRSTPRFLGGRAPGRAGAAASPRRGLRDGFVSPGAAARRDPVPPPRPPPPRRPAPAPARGRLAPFTDLRVGDYVVHEDHGIARFAGFETQDASPASPATTSTSSTAARTASSSPPTSWRRSRRYVGAGGDAPQLSALGVASAGSTIKARARRAARELAGELLNLYAERQARRGHAFARRRRVAARARARLPLSRDGRPARGDRGGQGRHGGGAADGPPDLRRRRLRQDRGRAARRLQGGRRRQAGDDAGADDDPRPAAPRHLPRAPRATSRSRSRWSRACASRPRSRRRWRASRTGKVDILIGTHRLLSRDVRAKDLGLRDRRRGAALRRQAEGAAAPAEAARSTCSRSRRRRSRARCR